MAHQLVHRGLLYFLYANFVRGGDSRRFGFYRAGGADLLVTFANLAGRGDAGGFNRAAFRVGFSGGCFRFAGGWSDFLRYGWRGFLLSGNRSGFFLSVRFIVRVLFLAFTAFYRKRLLRRWGFGMPCSMRQRREG